MADSMPKRPTGSFPPVLRLLDIYFSSLDPLPQKQRCLDLIVLYLKNIVMNPEVEKYRSIRVRNPRFTKDVAQCPGGDLLLLEIGFSKTVKEFEEYLVLPSSEDPSDHYWRVKKAKESMDEAIMHDKHAPANIIQKEKQAKDAIMRQIEEDARIRKQKEQRTRLSTDRLSADSSTPDHPRSAVKQASYAAQKRLEALSKPVVPATTMLPTPSLSHLNEQDYDRIYEPAEDSFALLDALQNDADLIRGITETPMILEVGSGSGIVSTFLQQSILPSSLHLCTDINEFACEATLATSRANTTASLTTIDTVRTSLIDGMRLGDIDLLIFNPPYVPTSASEIDTTGGISAAWAGGAAGMGVTDLLLPQVHKILSENGLFYLVAVSRNNPERILADASKFNLLGQIVLQRRAGREKLAILRLHKAPAPHGSTDSCTTLPELLRITSITSETRRLDGREASARISERTMIGTPD